MNPKSHRIAQNRPTLEDCATKQAKPESDFARACRRFAKGFHSRLPILVADFANELPDLPDLPYFETPVQDLSKGAEGECIANATSGPIGEDGWMRLTKFGDHPQGPDDLQRFYKKQSDAMVLRFKAAANAAVRLLFRSNPFRPVYYGHPDHPVFAARGHDDFTLRAEIQDMETRDDGLYIKPLFTDQGNDLLGAGRKLYWSPRWVSTMTGTENGKRIWEPFKLLSAGLTPTPNIMGSAANAHPASQHQPAHTMEWIKKLLISLGFTEDQANARVTNKEDAPSAEDIEQRATELRDQANGYFDIQEAIMKVLGYTDEEIDAAREDKTSAPEVSEMVSRLSALLSGAADQANEELTTAQAALTTANERITALEGDFANERTARATLVVEQAIAENRLEASRKDETIESLAKSEDFANASEKVLKADKVLPSGGATAEIGSRKGEMQDHANARHEYNEALADFANAQGYNLKGGDYQKAHRAFKRTKEGKALHDAIGSTPEGE